MGDRGMPYMLPPPDAAAEVIVGAGAGARAAPADHVQRRFLYAGRILVAAGWLVLTYYPAVGDRTANAEHAFLGLSLLLLGAFMIMVALAPVAVQFPAAARAGAAVADAVLSYFFAPGN
ncbi:hypothetical protein BS78_10G228200 [Paspalum vaginatum]|nr:hypothetical protein BS78_10G228200 [Paspalum vaginatum]